MFRSVFKEQFSNNREMDFKQLLSCRCNYSESLPMRVAKKCYYLFNEPFLTFVPVGVCVGLLFQLPATIAVVYHLPCHATVNADVLPGDEASLVAAKKKHHIGYVHWVAHAPGRLLCGVGACVGGAGGVYPSR